MRTHKKYDNSQILFFCAIIIALALLIYAERYLPYSIANCNLLFGADENSNKEQRFIWLTDERGNPINKISAAGKSFGDKLHLAKYHDQHIFAIVKDQALIKYDLHGNQIWQLPGGFHHDLTFDNDGNIWALERTYRKFAYQQETLPTLADRISKISSSGKRIQSTELLDIFIQDVPEKDLNAWKEWSTSATIANEAGPGDLLHTNSVQFINCQDWSACQGDPAILISLAQINMLAVLNLRDRSILWKSSQNFLERQHHASYLGNNEILVFDNGIYRGWTRVIKFDVRDEKILWQYKSDDYEVKPYTPSRGSAEMLTDGSILITHNTPARIMHVSADAKTLGVIDLHKRFDYIYRASCIPTDR